MRQKLIRLTAWMLIALPVSALAGADDHFVPVQQVYDERFFRFVEVDGRVETLATGFGWAEGPVWVPSLQSLLFSDVAGDAVYRWHETGGMTLYLKPSGHPPDDAGHAWRGANGLAIDADNRLLLAQQGRRVLARMRAGIAAPAPDYDVLQARYDGLRLNSPNDLLVSSSGDVFFTDPPYGLAGFEQSPDKELAYSGVYRLSAGGEIVLLDDSLEKPNGIALSPDEDSLFVSNSEPGKASVMVFRLDARLDASDRRRFFDARSLEAGAAGSTDGMAMHRLGFLFVSLPGGFGILSPQGELLGMLSLGQVTNLAFDENYRYLYLTQPDRLLRIRLATEEPVQ